MLISCTYKKSPLIFAGDVNNNNNIYSVLIGINGVGKSRLLSAVAINAAGIKKLPIATKNENLISVANELDPFYTKKFNGVITSSISPFDKFPVIKNNNNTKLNYKYLGVRGISSESVGLNHLSRVAGDLITQCINDASRIGIVEKVLGYLEYSDKLEFEFKFNYGILGVVFKINYEREQYESYFIDEELNKKNNGIDTDFYKFFKPLAANELIEENIPHYEKLVTGRKFHPAYADYFVTRLKEYICSLKFLSNLGFETIDKYFLNKTTDALFNTRIGVVINCQEKSLSFSKHASIDFIIDNFQVLIEAGVLTMTKANIRKKGHKKMIGVSSASSGEQSVFLSLLGIASYIKNNFLILIDEPEICLHPSWQEKYIDLLIKCFENLKGCHFIIATHSPQIVANLSGDNCYVVNMTEHETLSSNEFSKKSADFQLAKLFHAPGHRNEYLLKRITLILAEISSGAQGIDLDEIRDIIKLENSLPENDPVVKLISILKKAIKIIQ